MSNETFHYYTNQFLQVIRQGVYVLPRQLRSNQTMILLRSHLQLDDDHMLAFEVGGE